MAQQSFNITRQNFGRAIRLFAPIYLSNECVNNCAYCGFSRDNPILRLTLSTDALIREARHLTDQGFRHLLLVAGEHPKFVSSGYVQDCVKALRTFVPSIDVELGPTDVEVYRDIVSQGAEGLVVYQETYQRDAYSQYHTAGPKRNFEWRLNCPERGYQGGFRRIGLGVLFGLADWRKEAISLGAHLEYLQSVCWRSSYTVSFPRLRPAAGDFVPKYTLDDRTFVQLVCAFRICFPSVGIVLTTREAQVFRDALIPLGVSHMSAGSHTEPGGYLGQADDLHLTVRGKRVEVDSQESACKATEQFEVSDLRSPSEVASAISCRGFDPVWKDWDSSILNRS